MCRPASPLCHPRLSRGDSKLHFIYKKKLRFTSSHFADTISIPQKVYWKEVQDEHKIRTKIF